MLTAVAAFLLLLIALLAIPVTLTFRVSWPRILQNDINLNWAFGLVHIRIPSSEPKTPSPEHDELEPRISRLEPSSRKRQNFFAVVRQKQFRRRIIRFIRDLWHSVQKKNVRLRVRVGLGDPADTGQLWAVLGPVAGILANVQEASLEVEPEFLDSTFELDTSGSLRIIPLQMTYLTIALLLSPPVWQGIRQMRLVGK